jgi:hypothetical protein
VLESEGPESLDPSFDEGRGATPADLAVASWRKSLRSAANGSCVEVAHLRGSQVGVRDSKARGRGPVLVFSSRDWGTFLAGVKHGDFDIA